MAEPQLSVRGAKAARREHRSVADVVERALDAYEVGEAGREPAPAFHPRLATVIRESRQINPGPEL